jgi:hypothetical protein
MSEVKMNPRRILKLGCLYVAAAVAAVVILSVLGCAKADAQTDRRIKPVTPWTDLGNGVRIREIQTTNGARCLVGYRTRGYGDTFAVACL